MAKPSAAVMIDLEDRDPSNLSTHLEVSWSDVIGEPQTLRSPECVWRLSQHCFKHTLNYCYLALTVIFAPFAAFCFGCSFACLAFKHVWCAVPSVRIWRIVCNVTKGFVSPCLQATVVPCTESIGHLFSNIRVKNTTVQASPAKNEAALSYGTHVI